jgi:hypothetical protein
MDSDIIWLSAASHELETELDYVFCKSVFTEINVITH